MTYLYRRNDCIVGLRRPRASEGEHAKPTFQSIVNLAKSSLQRKPRVFGRGPVSDFTDILVSSVQQNKKVAWLFLTLVDPVTLGRHSNAIFVDLGAKAAYLFEPHGSDLQHPDQPDYMQRFYNSKDYFEHVRLIFDGVEERTKLGLKLHTPDTYMPGFFGQSVLPDKWCALWTMAFLVHSTLKSPQDFVAMTNTAAAGTKAGMIKFMTNMLRDTMDYMKKCKTAFKRPTVWKPVLRIKRTGRKRKRTYKRKRNRRGGFK